MKLNAEKLESIITQLMSSAVSDNATWNDMINNERYQNELLTICTELAVKIITIASNYEYALTSEENVIKATRLMKGQ